MSGNEGGGDQDRKDRNRRWQHDAPIQPKVVEAPPHVTPEWVTNRQPDPAVVERLKEQQRRQKERQESKRKPWEK